jgi:hypothetical protein
MLNTNVIYTVWRLPWFVAMWDCSGLAVGVDYCIFEIEAEVKFVNIAYNTVLDKLMCRII